MIDGEPTNDVLEAAKINLITEFSELMQDGKSNPLMNAQREYYVSRNHILGLTISLHALSSGHFEEAFDYLKDHGIKRIDVSDPKAVESLVKKIEAKIKLKQVKMSEAEKKCTSLASKDDDGKPTRDSFYDYLALFSRSNGFEIGSSITLSKYAAYMKRLKKEINHGNNNTKYRTRS